jgi:Mrp family chromosome partitioning ATPase
MKSALAEVEPLGGGTAAKKLPRPKPVGGQTKAIPQPTKRAKLLLLSSAKGGSSKTTTARNLAVAGAHAGSMWQPST